MHAPSSKPSPELGIPSPRPKLATKPTTNPNPNEYDKPNPNDLDLPIAIRKGTRTCIKHHLHLFMSHSNLSPRHRAFINSLNTIPIPKTLFEAIDNGNWKNAMEVDMALLEKNQTWELVKLPKGKKPVWCKWVFAMKYRSDRSLKRYKGRLVAKKYTQTYGVDYLEIFAPVAKMNTIGCYCP